MQVGPEEKSIFRVMVKPNEFSKKQFFMETMKAQKPISIKALQISRTGTLFFNFSTSIKDAAPHDLNFKFETGTETVTKIGLLLTDLTSGIFHVSGMIKWKEPARIAEKTGQFVRDATLTDNSGTIDLSIWGQQIDQIKEESFYTLTNCKLRFYYGKCLSTTRITDANSQNISSVPLRSQSENWICCPQILNVAVNSYPVCNNKDCSKKITSNPAGAQIVRCISCNRSSSLMLCSAICKKK